MAEVKLSPTDAILFGRHILEAYDPARNVVDAARVASLLLYFEKLHLVRLWWDLKPLDCTVAEAGEVVEKIVARYGRDAVGAYIGRKVNAEQFTVGEQIQLDAFIDHLKTKLFVDAYKPALDAVLFPIALKDQFVATTSDAGELNGLEVAMHLFSKLQERFAETVSPYVTDEFFESAATPGSATAVSALLAFNRSRNAAFFRERYEPMLSSRDEAVRGYFAMSGWLAAMLTYAFAGILVGGKSTVVLSQEHARVRNDAVGLLGGSEPAERLTDEVQMTASRLLGRLLVRLPIIIPKSVADIVEVRHRLRDELVGFRETLNTAVLPLLRESSVTERDLDYAVEKNLVQPLAALRGRLARPGADLLKNLFSGPAAVTASLTFAASFAVDPRTALGPLLAASGATLVAAVKARLDRGALASDSGVEFLLRLSDA